MANEKRLIDVDAEIEAIKKYACNDCESYDGIKCRSCWADDLIGWIEDAPKVDAVPVDEIRVDFEQLCLENQEAVLNVSICGKSNEVKIPFSKEVAEVVHGRWEDKWGGKYANPHYVCSNCKKSAPYKCDYNVIATGLWTQDLTDYCPNCGAKMDGDGNG